MRQELWYGNDQQEKQICGLTMLGIFVGFLALLLGNATPVKADAVVHMTNAIRIEKNQATQHYFGLDRILRERHLNRDNVISAEVRTTFVGLRDSIVSIKAEIEAAAPGLRDEHYDAFTHVLMIYYELQQQLYVAHSYFQNAISVFGQMEMNALKIRVPTLVAQGVQSRLIDKLLHDNISSYHVSFVIVPVEDRNPLFSFIEPSSDMRRQYSARSLLAYPNQRLGRDVWRQAALKILFFENASNNAFLYNDEKRPVTLVSGLDRDNQNFIDLLQQDAEKIIIEEDFRPAFFSQVLPLLALKAPLNQSLSVARLADFFAMMLPIYRRHIEYRNVADATSVDDILTSQHLRIASHNLANEYALNSTHDIIQAMQQTLNHSAVMYGSLRGEALNQALVDIMKATERRQIEYALGCLIFKDLAGAQSKCNTPPGPLEPQVYTTANDWTPLELARFRMRISDFVDKLYSGNHDGPNSAAIWQGVANIRETIADQVVSNKRYDMAKRLFTGAQLWVQMEQAVKHLDTIIAANRGRTAANQLPVPPTTPQGFTIIPHHPVPGYVFLAVDQNSPLNRAQYEPSTNPIISTFGLDSPRFREFADSFITPDQTYNTAPWMGEILKNFAKKSSVTQNAEQRQNLQVELQQLVGRLDTLGTSIVNISGGNVLLQMQRAQARHTVTDDVWARALAFVRPVIQYFDLWDRISNAVGNGNRDVTDQEIVFDDLPIVSAPRTPAIQTITTAYQTLNREERFRWMALGDQLTQLAQTLGEAPRGVVANPAASARPHANEQYREELDFINGLRQLIQLGDRYESGSLSSLARRLLERVIQGDVAQVLLFHRDVNNFSSYLGRHRGIVTAIFQEPAARDAALANILRHDPKAMKDYLLYSIVDIQQRFPLLVRRLKLPNEVQSEIGYEGTTTQRAVGIPLYKIVGRMSHAASTLNFTATIDAAIERVRNLQGPYNASTLSQPLVTGNIAAILNAAIPLAERRHTNNIGVRWDRFWEGGTPPQTLDVPDQWWRSVVPLKVRDILGATLDTTSPPDVRAGAVLTSALLSPYYRAIVDKGVTASRDLVNPDKSVWQALGHSESAAMKLLFMEAGGMARGIEQIRTREMFWDQWRQQLVTWSSQLNVDIFHIYFSNLFLKFIPAENAVMHVVMLGAAMSDAALNWTLRAQYLHNYSALSEFAPFLIPDESVTVAQSMYAQQVRSLRERLPNDIIWFGSSLVYYSFRHFGGAITRTGRFIDNATTAVTTAVARRVNSFRASRAEANGTHIINGSGALVEMPSHGDYQALGVEPGASNAIAQRGYRNRMRAREAETGQRYNENDPIVVAAETALARIEGFNAAIESRLPGSEGASQYTSEALDMLRRACSLLGVRAGASKNSVLQAIERMAAAIPQQAGNIRVLLRNVLAYFELPTTRQLSLSPDFSDPKYTAAFEALGINEAASNATIQARHRAALREAPGNEELLNQHLVAALEYATYRYPFSILGIQPGMGFREAYGAFLNAIARGAQARRTITNAWNLARPYFLVVDAAAIEPRIPASAAPQNASTANAFQALGAVPGEAYTAFEARYRALAPEAQAALADQWNLARSYFDRQQSYMRSAAVMIPLVVPEWIATAAVASPEMAPAAPGVAGTPAPVAPATANGAVAAPVIAPGPGANDNSRGRFRLRGRITDPNSTPDRDPSQRQ